jgi:hypothetical protein
LTTASASSPWRAVVPGAIVEGVTPTKEADMAEDTRDTAGMRAVFWIWAGIIGVGLAVMIGLPLGGR